MSRGSSLLTRVNELINPVTGEWDEQLIYDSFWPEDATVILQIPIDEEMDGWPAWHFDSKGLFSVKSAYKLAVAKREQSRMCHHQGMKQVMKANLIGLKYGY